MADRRKELQTLLETMLGSRNVYFQPPENFKMKYDCIVYKKDPERSRHADNRVYTKLPRWQITVMTQSPIAPIIQEISELPTCRHEQSFVRDNLYHNIYELYF